MSTKIQTITSVQDINLLRVEFNQWFQENPDKRKRYPIDNLEPIILTLPKDREEETLREILKTARMTDKLSFRFWWAVRSVIDSRQIGLQVSFATHQDFDSFLDICEKYQETPAPT